MVFVAHILGGTAEHIYADRPSYISMIERPWNLGVYGVELFFVISGFVILPSVIRYTPREFALRRFWRLYPLFFVFTLLFAALNLATNAYPKLNSLEAFVVSLLFMDLFTGTEQLTPNAWSLSFEVIFYTLTCVLVFFWMKRPSRLGAVLAGGVAVSFLAVYPISIYFLAGLGIRCLHDRRLNVPPAFARYLELFFLGCCIFFASIRHFDYEWSEFDSPLVLIIIISTAAYFYLAIAKDSLTSRLLANRISIYLGTVSYSLYLVHPYTYFVCRELFDRWGLFTRDITASMLLFFSIVTPLTFVITHIIHQNLEVRPYQHFFGQRIYRTAGVQGWRQRLGFRG